MNSRKGKQLLAVLLSLVTLSQVFTLTGCSENEAQDTTTKQDTPSNTQTSESEDDDNVSGEVETKEGLIGIEVNYNWKDGVKEGNYNGDDFTILNGCTSSWYSYLTVTAEDITGESVNDAIYERIQRTNEYLNINVLESQQSSSHDVLRKAVQAGVTEYDVALCSLMNDYALAIEGNIYDLNTIDGFDSSGSWWDQNSVNDLTINNKLYFATSDFDTTRFDGIRTLYFNKDLIAAYGLENPYDLVDNNQWTLDKFIEIASQGVADADGDGVMTDMDSYGYICYSELAADLLFCGTGLKYIQKDSETGRLVDGTTEEKTIDVYSKIYKLFYEGNTTFDVRASKNSSYLRGQSDRIQEELFAEGRILFYSECMAWTRVLREMDADFGILPPPKYDETQDRYYSVMVNTFMQMVPASVQTPEKSVHVLDVLAAASHDTVVDAYVNGTLSGKVARDPDTVRMLKLVFDNLSYNLHFSTIPIRSTIINAATGGTENLTSTLAKITKAVNKTLNKTNEEFFED